MSKRRLLSVEEVGARLEIARATVYRYIDRGFLTPKPLVPNGIGFDPAEVAALARTLRSKVRRKVRSATRTHRARAA